MADDVLERICADKRDWIAARKAETSPADTQILRAMCPAAPCDWMPSA